MRELKLTRFQKIVMIIVGDRHEYRPTRSALTEAQKVDLAKLVKLCKLRIENGAYVNAQEITNSQEIAK